MIQLMSDKGGGPTLLFIGCHDNHESHKLLQIYKLKKKVMYVSLQSAKLI